MTDIRDTRNRMQKQLVRLLMCADLLATIDSQVDSYEFHRRFSAMWGECSHRTVYRDLRTLAAVGLAVETKGETTGGTPCKLFEFDSDHFWPFVQRLVASNYMADDAPLWRLVREVI